MIHKGEGGWRAVVVVEEGEGQGQGAMNLPLLRLFELVELECCNDVGFGV